MKANNSKPMNILAYQNSILSDSKGHNCIHSIESNCRISIFLGNGALPDTGTTYNHQNPIQHSEQKSNPEGIVQGDGYWLPWFSSLAKYR